MLIVLRVVKGEAYSRGTVEQTMTGIQFNSPTPNKTSAISMSNTGNTPRLPSRSGVLSSRDIQIQLETGPSYDDFSGGSSAGMASNDRSKDKDKDSHTDSSFKETV